MYYKYYVLSGDGSDVKGSMVGVPEVIERV